MNGHNLFFNFFSNRELNELFVSMSIRSFAISLIGIFIPIYLYQLGYSFSSIFLFFGFVAFFNLIFLFPASKISYRYGLKHGILFSTPFIVIFLFLLFSLETFNWPLILLAFIMGIQSSLFWFAYHVDFSKFSSKKIRGTQIGFSKILISIFSILGPIIGALIITFFGFKVLFVVASFLLLGSNFPLFLTKEIHEPVKFSFKGLFEHSTIKNKISYMGYGIETGLSTIIWPLFIFIFIFGEKYFSLGLFSSITFFSSLAFIFLFGRYSNINRKLTLKMGTISNSVVWVIKSFIVTPFQVFIIGIFYGASRTAIDISFTALNYDQTNNKNRAKIILEREIFIKIGGIVLFFIMSFAFDYIVASIRYGGPLSSLMMFFF